MNQSDSVKLISEEKLRAVIETHTCVATLGLDLNAVMDMAAERTRSITNALASSVELVNGKRMAFHSDSNVVSKSVWLRLPGNALLPGPGVTGYKTLHSEDSDNSPHIHRLVLHKHGLCFMLVMPLLHLGQPVAVLKLISATASGFSRSDMEILKMMSALFSASIYNATKYTTSALFHQATTDDLTGLPNRALFFDRLRRAHAIAKREERPMGVLVLDLDGLKSINDRFGHRAGDAAIVEMGQRIKAVIRSADAAARLGGDEFAVVLYRLETGSATGSVIERINKRCNQPFVFEDNIIPLTVSTGMAQYPEDSKEWESLMDMADKQMYQNKREKVNLIPEHCHPPPPMQRFDGRDRAPSFRSPARIQSESDQN